MRTIDEAGGAVGTPVLISEQVSQLAVSPTLTWDPLFERNVVAWPAKVNGSDQVMVAAVCPSR